MLAISNNDQRELFGDVDLHRDNTKTNNYCVIAELSDTNADVYGPSSDERDVWQHDLVERRPTERRR